jgi:hypothetical protein
MKEMIKPYTKYKFYRNFFVQSVQHAAVFAMDNILSRRDSSVVGVPSLL